MKIYILKLWGVFHSFYSSEEAAIARGYKSGEGSFSVEEWVEGVSRCQRSEEYDGN